MLKISIFKSCMEKQETGAWCIHAIFLLNASYIKFQNPCDRSTVGWFLGYYSEVYEIHEYTQVSLVHTSLSSWGRWIVFRCLYLFEIIVIFLKNNYVSCQIIFFKQFFSCSFFSSCINPKHFSFLAPSYISEPYSVLSTIVQYLIWWCSLLITLFGSVWNC